MEAVGEYFDYSCLTGFNATEDSVVTSVDTACTEDVDNTPQGVRACQGEPFHSKFFTKTPF